jgi:hypothetical protein
LKTFSSLKKETVIKGTAKEIALQTDNIISSHMLCIAQTRKIYMKEVFCHPLGPTPWALGNADRTLKTANTSLSAHTLQQAAFVDLSNGSQAATVDTKGMVQKIDVENCTFG